MLSCAAVALFLQGLGLGFYAAAQPGPFQAYLLAQSARNGPRRTLPIVIVPLVSDPPIIAAVLAVLANVPAGFVRALQVAGGALLLWLAAGAIRAARAAAPVAGEPEPPRGFWRAVFVNLTNPSAWMFWSLVGGPILSGAWRSARPGALAFLFGFYALLLGGNAAFILLAGGIGRLGPSFSRTLGVLSGVALLGLGVWQVGRGLAGA